MQAQRLASANMEVLSEARQLAKELAGKTIVENQFAQMSKIVEERARLREEARRNSKKEVGSMVRLLEDRVAASQVSQAALQEVRSGQPPTRQRQAAPVAKSQAGKAVSKTEAPSGAEEKSPLEQAKVPLLRASDWDDEDKAPKEPPLTCRRSLFLVLEGDGCVGQFYLTSFFLLITVNFFSFALSTEPSFQNDHYYKQLFKQIETASVYFFTFEYALRWWTAPELSPDLCKDRCTEFCLRLRYAFFNFFSFIDLLSILPFYIALLSPDLDFLNTQWIRVLRILRVVP
jgi:hypothetical protein